MTNVKFIVYTQNNKMGKTGEFDSAKEAIKWAKAVSYTHLRAHET